MRVSPEELGFLETLTFRIRLEQEPTAVAAELEAALNADPDNAGLYDSGHMLYHERLHDYAAAYRITAARAERHPDDLAVRRNLAVTLLTTGHTAEARNALSALIDGHGQETDAGGADPSLPPGTEAALRLLESAALARLADSGEATDTATDAVAALAERREQLPALLAAQAEGFSIDGIFDGTLHYLATDTRYAGHRDILVPMFAAAQRGPAALLERLDER